MPFHNIIINSWLKRKVASISDLIEASNYNLLICSSIWINLWANLKIDFWII
jgi:hypothetical protein